MGDPTLFDPLRTHCVFCPHVVESFTGDPLAMHDEMERHYSLLHQRDLQNIIGPIGTSHDR